MPYESKYGQNFGQLKTNYNDSYLPPSDQFTELHEITNNCQLNVNILVLCFEKEC